ncbi:MAG: hypothetical protein J6L98_05530, partial [Bacteroidales bacterium]|nr:hypothetical protein [Bacteroidales bacterium]
DGIYARFGNEYYFGLDGLGSGTWFKEGHLFVQALFRILNTGNSSLVHGACLGLDGKGVLMCARGGGGKSTLSVTAMLRGFEFVSDDYLILSENGGNVAASPIYSFITLSPEMYDALYDDFGEARFLGVSHWKGKYVFDISEYAGSFRSNYPVKAIMFPELCLDAAAPKVALCSPAERGRTITQIAHSTVSQMFIKGFRGDQRDPDFILKIVKALSGFDCYKITLSRDLDANVGCLREFISNL